MSHLLSHHSIKRAEETSFHWNINLLKIVCNTTEQKKILTFYIHVYPQLFLFDIVSFVCGAGRGCCWWFDDSEMFGFHRLGFHCSFMFNVCFDTPLQSLKLNQNKNDVQGHFRYCRFLILCVYLIPWLLHFV